MHFRGPVRHVIGLLLMISLPGKEVQAQMNPDAPVHQAGTLDVTKPSDNEIVLTRTFAASRERVFSAMTQASHILRWMKPSAMTLVGCEFDLRVGGNLRYVFQRPNGRTIEVRGVFQAVQPPSRFLYVETYDFSPLRIHVTTALDVVDEKTVLRQTLLYASKAERDEDYDGIASSSAELFANLERYLAQPGE